MKKNKIVWSLFFVILIFSGCASNPLSGKKTMAFVSNSSLFPSAFAQYEEFLKESTVIKNTPDALMITRVGNKLAQAAQMWLESEGYPDYLKDYQWEYNLVKDDAINAWCMPGGKIVFYTGILPVTQTEAGVAAVMGHEISHALLNHSQQQSSASILQQIGAVGVLIATSGMSEGAQSLSMTAYETSSALLGTLPFSRSHETEADRYGTILMAIAGYNPEEAVYLWERMSALGGSSVPEILSTHPSNASRIKELKSLTSEAKATAAKFGVYF